MTKTRAGRIVIASLAFALGTVALGWPAVPIVAFAWGVVMHRARPALDAGLSAALGWMILLGWAAVRGGAQSSLAIISGVMKLPAAAMIVLVLLLPFVLGWSAAYLSAAIAGAVYGARTGAEAA